MTVACSFTITVELSFVPLILQSFQHAGRPCGLPLEAYFIRGACIVVIFVQSLLDTVVVALNVLTTALL
jgi:hypothetical protein